MILPRSSWQSGNDPVTGPASLPNEWRYNTLHWPGGTISVTNPVATLRAMQAAWTRSKGYSLGYNFVVFPNGTAYEVRGFDIRCAANGDQSVNRPGVAIQLAVPDVHTDPTTAMINGVREVIAATRSRVSQQLIINAHRDIRPEPTQCCGDVIAGMITAGVFEPGETKPIEEGEGMIFRTNGTGDAVFAQGSDMNVRHVTAAEGAVAQAGQPGWADSAPTLTLPQDVYDWLNGLVQ